MTSPYALRIGVDWIALSFVQRAADMAELRRLVGGKRLGAGQDRKARPRWTDLGAILDQCDGGDGRAR